MQTPTEYYVKNKQNILEQVKKYRLENKETLAEYRKEYSQKKKIDFGNNKKIIEKPTKSKLNFIKMRKLDAIVVVSSAVVILHNISIPKSTRH